MESCKTAEPAHGVGRRHLQSVRSASLDRFSTFHIEDLINTLLYVVAVGFLHFLDLLNAASKTFKEQPLNPLPNLYGRMVSGSLGSVNPEI